MVHHVGEMNGDVCDLFSKLIQNLEIVQRLLHTGLLVNVYAKAMRNILI